MLCRPSKFANFVYVHITRGKINHFRGNFSSKMVTFSARNTNVYKICKLRKAIFSVFYNISPPNFAILLILHPLSSCSKRFRSSCVVRPLVYYANCPLHTPDNFYFSFSFNESKTPHSRLTKDFS